MHVQDASRCSESAPRAGLVSFALNIVCWYCMYFRIFASTSLFPLFACLPFCQVELLRRDSLEVRCLIVALPTADLRLSSVIKYPAVMAAVVVLVAVVVVVVVLACVLFCKMVKLLVVNDFLGAKIENKKKKKKSQ